MREDYLSPIFGQSNALTIVVGSICAMGVVLILLRIANDYFRENNTSVTRKDDIIGLLVATALFGVMIFALNIKTVKLESFCLMNSNEFICQKKWHRLDYNKSQIDCLEVYGINGHKKNGEARFDNFSGFLNITQAGTDQVTSNVLYNQVIMITYLYLCILIRT